MITEEGRKDIHSTYMNGDYRADVFKTADTWGCDFYDKDVLIKSETYETKSVYFAESAAENYVAGVKTI
tara:strand:+ start:884 stop:1090 length:207 start_codon:yes stop_codon:yes gene_type:complete